MRFKFWNVSYPFNKYRTIRMQKSNEAWLFDILMLFWISFAWLSVSLFSYIHNWKLCFRIMVGNKKALITFSTEISCKLILNNRNLSEYRCVIDSNQMKMKWRETSAYTKKVHHLKDSFNTKKKWKRWSRNSMKPCHPDFPYDENKLGLAWFPLLRVIIQI